MTSGSTPSSTGSSGASTGGRGGGRSHGRGGGGGGRRTDGGGVGGRGVPRGRRSPVRPAAVERHVRRRREDPPPLACGRPGDPGRGHARAEPVVDVDDQHARRAGGEHREQGG